MQAIVLTDTSDLSRFLADLTSASVPGAKVVTGWGLGRSWTADDIRQMVGLPGLIVRTVTGDGCRPSPRPDGYIFPEPQTVLQELSPWLYQRPNMLVEIGNEPNHPQHDSSTDAAYRYWYYYRESVKPLKATFPAVRVISPGLHSANQAAWWQAAVDPNAPTVPYIDLVGFHAYATIPGDMIQIAPVLDQLRSFFPNRTWAGTELGINDPNTSPASKASSYANLHRDVPAHVALCCWYHQCDRPIDDESDDQKDYQLPPSVWGDLQAGGTL